MSVALSLLDHFYHNVCMHPPPLPPKPPAEVVSRRTQVTDEFRTRLPERVSSLVDKRPSYHPLGPRQLHSDAPQQTNRYLGVYSSSQTPNWRDEERTVERSNTDGSDRTTGSVTDRASYSSAYSTDRTSVGNTQDYDKFWGQQYSDVSRSSSVQSWRPDSEQPPPLPLKKPALNTSHRSPLPAGHTPPPLPPQIPIYDTYGEQGYDEYVEHEYYDRRTPEPHHSVPEPHYPARQFTPSPNPQDRYQIPPHLSPGHTSYEAPVDLPALDTQDWSHVESAYETDNLYPDNLYESPVRMPVADAYMSPGSPSPLHIDTFSHLPASQQSPLNHHSSQGSLYYTASQSPLTPQQCSERDLALRMERLDMRPAMERMDSRPAMDLRPTLDSRPMDNRPTLDSRPELRPSLEKRMSLPNGMPKYQSTPSVSPSRFNSMPNKRPVPVSAGNTPVKHLDIPEYDIMSDSVRSDSAWMELDLPSIPTRPQVDLSNVTYTCPEMWSLSGVRNWIRPFFSGDKEVPEKDLHTAVSNLFAANKTLSPVYAEQYAKHVIGALGRGDVLRHDEERGSYMFSDEGVVSGVIPALTLCYSKSSHDSGYTCYSTKCPYESDTRKREERKRTESASSDQMDWAQYWELTDDQLARIDPREIKRQYAMHELIVGEEHFIRDLDILHNVYGESLKSHMPDKQFRDMFAVQDIIQCSKELLQGRLKARHIIFVTGIADIIIEWIKVARPHFLAYANRYLHADRRIRKEREDNVLFSQWLGDMSKDPRTLGKPYSIYFHRVIPRLARYSLLLGTISKHTTNEMELELLTRAIAECDDVTRQCNMVIGNVEKQVELLDLKSQFVFKPDCGADLKLESTQRKIMRRGDVQRKSDYGLEWIDAHLVLLDNFLVLCKHQTGQHGPKLYVTKKPIPLELLCVEQIDEAEQQSKGRIHNITSHVREVRDKRMSFMGDHHGGSSSPGTVTVLNDDSDQTTYPFRIRHLGQNLTYTLFCPSSGDRDRWHTAMVEAKRQYSSKVYAKNAEPFRLTVLSYLDFGYEIPVRLAVPNNASTLQRAIEKAGVAGKPYLKTQPSSASMTTRSRVNCATSFMFDSREFVFVGTDYGVFVSELSPETRHKGSSSNKYKRCVDLHKVTQVGVIETLNLVLLLCHRGLIYYHLDQLLNRSMTKDAATPMGYKLSSSASFFTIGNMKNRTLVFYKSREGLNSVFKVLEPIRQKGSQKKRSRMSLSRFSSHIGSTEYFRDAERFYVPSECWGISVFKNYFSVHCTKGFEAMSLDFKVPRTLPIISSGATDFRKRLEGLRPLAMFQISDSKFMLCYDELLVYTDHFGNLASKPIPIMVKAKGVALQHPYLVIVDDEMAEIRHIDGTLKQVIPGQDMRLIDDHDGQIKLCMANPNIYGRQLIVELNTNELIVDDDDSSLTGL
ncbi:Rho1 guanine nucleotide exchange factor 3 [Yarrowia sp. C11]|nr:Rho1 guanine nucleotide exchange factor 3 [Yarrowia sp. E02]KAG5371812.1 Rho1 guanine nucleotide exchange factor 3 [Yarrowia sp. C11]